MKKIINILKWSAIAILAGFILLVIARIPFYIQNQKTEEHVAKIHATKLAMDDVMGINLPPDPGTEAHKTVAGIDANEKGTRDDVELAIFKEYPGSAKTRAVLLQYALALQMEMVQPVVNSGTVGAVAEQKSRGYLCIGETIPREDFDKFVEESNKLHEFVEKLQLNTVLRKNYRVDFYKKLTSGEVPRDYCDIDLNSLPN